MGDKTWDISEARSMALGEHHVNILSVLPYIVVHQK